MSDSTFLVRLIGGQQTLAARCYIRHVPTGREAFIQGGPEFLRFLQACLLPGIEAATEGGMKL